MMVYEATLTMEPPEGYDTPFEMEVAFVAEDMDEAGDLTVDAILDCAELPITDLDIAEIGVDPDEYFSGEAPSSPDEPLGSGPQTPPSPPSPDIEDDDHFPCPRCSDDDQP